MNEPSDPRGGPAPSVPQQIPTGIRGLDRLLRGGLRRGALHAITGGPGAGKSVLAHQIGSHLVAGGGRVLYLTSLVESHQSLVSQGRTFRFFDSASVAHSFYYASLYPTLSSGGLSGAREEITRLVGQLDPTLVVLDGVHALKVMAQNRLDYQRFVHELEAQAMVLGITMLLLIHPPQEDIASDPAFTIADAIIHMRTRQTRLRDVRLFSVGKLRGVGHVGGWHTFEITSHGIRIYPRIETLEAKLASQAREEDGERRSPLGSAVEGLDAMLGGGLERNSTTLVVGTPGSGKTLFGLAFLSAGAAAGERGLLLGFHEPPSDLVAKAESTRLPLRKHLEEGSINIQWRPPTELLVDREVEHLLETVERDGIRRVVIDALEDVRHGVIPRSRELSVFSALANLLRDRGVTSIILQDLPRIVGLNLDLPMAELAAVVDNAIHLRYLERSGELKRLIAVLKVRARPHDHRLRELVISDRGISVGEPYTDVEMILTGLGFPR